MTVQDVIKQLKDNDNVIYIDVDIVPASEEGYLVKIEYWKKSRHGRVVPYYVEYIVPGHDMTPKDILNSAEFYRVSVVVNKKYAMIWRRRRGGLRI